MITPQIPCRLPQVIDEPGQHRRQRAALDATRIFPQGARQRRLTRISRPNRDASSWVTGACNASRSRFSGSLTGTFDSAQVVARANRATPDRRPLSTLDATAMRRSGLRQRAVTNHDFCSGRRSRVAARRRHPRQDRSKTPRAERARIDSEQFLAVRAFDDSAREHSGAAATPSIAISRTIALMTPERAGPRIAENVANTPREIARGRGCRDERAGAAMAAHGEDLRPRTPRHHVRCRALVSSQARSRSSSICRPIHHTAGETRTASRRAGERCP